MKENCIKLVLMGALLFTVASCKPFAKELRQGANQLSPECGYVVLNGLGGPAEIDFVKRGGMLRCKSTIGGIGIVVETCVLRTDGQGELDIFDLGDVVQVVKDGEGVNSRSLRDLGIDPFTRADLVMEMDCARNIQVYRRGPVQIEIRGTEKSVLLRVARGKPEIRLEQWGGKYRLVIPERSYKRLAEVSVKTLPTSNRTRPISTVDHR